MTIQTPDDSADRGFTLIELLVVMAILPLIMGAIAAAVIVSIRTAQSTSNRLSDSLDAQITSAYFGRDVQGANYVTTTTVTSFSETSPAVCGSNTPPTTDPGILMVGLYHPEVDINGTPAQQALDVAYWLTGSAPNYSLVRYSCTLTSAFQGTLESKGVIATNVSGVNSTTLQAVNPAIIEPPQFQGTGWIPNVATTFITSIGGSSNPYTLGVLSVSGFAGSASTPGVVNLATSTGNVQLTHCVVSTAQVTLACNVPTGTSVQPGEEVTQNSISDITLGVTQSPTNHSATGSINPVDYHYSLTAAPRIQTPWGAAAGTTTAGGISPYVPGGGGGGPSLVTLSTYGVQIGGHDTVTVSSGGATVDAGSVSCNGSNANITVSPATGYTAPPGVTNSCPQTLGSGTYQPDPIAPYLPTCMPIQPVAPNPTSTGGILTYWPGRYSSLLSVPSSTHTVVYFKPGVYELDGGLSVKSSHGVEIAPGAIGGVLLYVTGYTTVPGCASAASTGAEGSFDLEAQGSLGLPPLTAAQSVAAFGGNPNLGGVWLWQDQSNSNAATLGGGSSASAKGLAYLPSAIVNVSASGQAYVGELICAGLGMQAGGNGSGLNITGT